MTVFFITRRTLPKPLQTLRHQRTRVESSLNRQTEPRNFLHQTQIQIPSIQKAKHHQNRQLPELAHLLLIFTVQQIASFHKQRLQSLVLQYGKYRVSFYNREKRQGNYY